MDTRTGEIFRTEEMAELRRQRNEEQAAEIAAEKLAQLERYEKGIEDGHVVPVSEQVARQQLAGQEAEKRRVKRKAAKAARKKNR